MNRRTRLIVTGAAALLLGAPGRVFAGDLSADDISRIRVLDKVYTSAWMRNDARLVLETFAEDGVIVPPGSLPRAGREELRRFFWPDDGSRTRVTSYTTTISEVGGSGDVGFVRGTGKLAFAYEKDGRRSERESRSVYLMIVRRQPRGNWLITHRMWSDLGS